MAYLALGNSHPGMGGLLSYRPQTAGPLMELAEVLLRGDSTLSRGDRELVAAYVSHLNACVYCANSHGACAAAQLPGGTAHVQRVLTDVTTAPISDKLRTLLHIAGLVQSSGRLVTPEDVARAHAEGATDVEIHDTVLIAAAFCMYNRYVDGLGATTPDDAAAYEAIGTDLARNGYLSRPAT